MQVEAAPRVQAAAPERAAHPHALPAAASATRRPTCRRARSSSAARPRPATSMAKLIIRLINAAADVVNRDPAVRDRLKVVFFPDFNVKNARYVYPAADLSRADLHGREGGVRHRQHEVRHERRADHRHARRGQRRDSRGGRRGELLPLRPDGRWRRQPASAAAIGRATGTSRMRRCARCSTSSRRGALAGGDTGLFRPLRGQPAGPRSRSSCSPTTSAYVDCQEQVSGLWRHPERLDAHVHPERGPHGQVLVRPVDPRLLRSHLGYAGGGSSRARSGDVRAAARVQRTDGRSIIGPGPGPFGPDSSEEACT